MTVVVTGASGHIGANLVRALLERGERVRAVVLKDGNAVAGLPVEIVSADVLDKSSLQHAFHKASMVYHLAAKISVDGGQRGSVHKINVQGTKNVVSACLATGVKKLVHFSTIHAISPHPKHAQVCEETPLINDREGAVYDRSKAMAEICIHEGVAQGLEAVIVSPVGVIGPHDHKVSRMGSFFLDLYHGKLPALVDGGFNWVDARDVSEGAIQAGLMGKSGHKYILSGHWHTLKELAVIAQSITGKKIPSLTVPLSVAKAVSYPHRAFCNLFRIPAKLTPESVSTLRNYPNISCEKAERELQFRARPVQESIADIYGWFKKTMML